MKKLKDQLKTVTKTLVSLSKQVERVSKQVEKLEAKKTAAVSKKKAPARKAAAKKAPAKRAKASGGATVLDSVFNVIKRSKKGVTIPAMRQKTKLDARQLSNALYKLTKKGMIKTTMRGVYVKK